MVNYWVWYEAYVYIETDRAVSGIHKLHVVHGYPFFLLSLSSYVFEITGL